MENIWRPISVKDLNNLLAKELEDCSLEQQRFFEKYHVPAYKVPINRLGKLEEVFVVAKLPKGIIYYEDIEEGFAFDSLGQDGAIPTQNCSQFELRHVLTQLMTKNNN